MTIVDVKIPPLRVDQYYVALVVGASHVEFQDELVLAHAVGEFHRGAVFYVIGTDAAPSNELSEDVLRLFGCRFAEDLHSKLCKFYQTGLPHNVLVTVYSLTQIPPDQWSI